MTILIWISVTSFIIISIMIGLRLTAIRDGKISVLEQPTLFSALQEKIDWSAVLFVLVCRDSVKFISLQVLIFLKKIVSYLRVGTMTIEKRFTNVIDVVHGKGSINKKGAVSFFLREIKEHNDKVKAKSL